MRVVQAHARCASATSHFLLACFSRTYEVQTQRAMSRVAMGSSPASTLLYIRTSGFPWPQLSACFTSARIFRSGREKAVKGCNRLTNMHLGSLLCLLVSMMFEKGCAQRSAFASTNFSHPSADQWCGPRRTVRISNASAINAVQLSSINLTQSIVIGGS
jgi:hypothetical protein